jgi:hypothetical protein
MGLNGQNIVVSRPIEMFEKLEQKCGKCFHDVFESDIHVQSVIWKILFDFKT